MKNRNIAFRMILLMLAVLLLVSFGACKAEPEFFTVSWEGTEMQPITALPGERIVLPAVPEKSGFITVLTVDGKEVKPFDEIVVTGDVLISVSYVKPSYTLSWNGIARAPETVDETGKYVVPSDLPQKEGFELYIMFNGVRVQPGEEIVLTEDSSLICSYRKNAPCVVTYYPEVGPYLESETWMRGSVWTVPDFPTAVELKALGYMPKVEDPSTLETVIKIDGRRVHSGEEIIVTKSLDVYITYPERPQVNLVSFVVPDGVEPIPSVSLPFGDELELPSISSFPYREGYDLKVTWTDAVNTEPQELPEYGFYPVSDTVIVWEYVENPAVHTITINGVESEPIVIDNVPHNRLWKVPYHVKENALLSIVTDNSSNTLIPGNEILIDGDREITYGYSEDETVTASAFGVVLDGVYLEELCLMPEPILNEDGVYVDAVPMNMYNVLLPFTDEDCSIISIVDQNGVEVHEGDILDYSVSRDRWFTVTVRTATPGLEYITLADEDGNQYLEVSKYTGNDERVIIPDHATDHDTMASYSVGSIGTGVFSGHDEIRSVELPNSLRSIEHYAFKGCTSLENVVIPATIEKIGDYAFRDCSSLESIVIEEGAKGAFHTEGNCLIEDRVYDADKIRKTLIAGCRNSIIPEGTEAIGNYAFSNSGLNGITIPASVEYIGNFAFQGCSSNVLVLPVNVGNIGASVFADASYGRVEIPEGIESIDVSSFSNSSIGEIVIDEANTNFTIEDGYLKDTRTEYLIARIG